VFTRVAQTDGCIFLNLANSDPQIVKITNQQWSIVASTKADVRFCNHKGVVPLPQPICGGTLNGLRSLVNVLYDDWPLVIGFAPGVLPLARTLPHSGPTR
jgi:hypothetical protein